MSNIKKKQKIVLIVDYHPLAAGGMEAHAYELYKILKRKKRLQLCGIIGFSSNKKNFNYIDKTIVLPPKATFQPSFIFKAIKELKLKDGDILFCNSLYWIRVIPELQKKFPKIIFLLRSGGNDIAQAQIEDKGKILKKRRRFIVNTINKSADLLIVNSRYSYRKFCGFGLSKNKMAIIKGGVDTERFKPVLNQEKVRLRKKFGLPENKIIILSSCRLVRFKGIDYVIKAISQSNKKSSIHYLLIGDGPEKEKLMRLIKRLRLEDIITMTGEVPIGLMHYYYQLSDIYCHAPILTRNFVLGGSYIHTETMGRSFYEAMSSALPVIATNVGGVSDVVKNKKSGVLVPARNIYSLKKEMESLISNKSRRKEMGLQGRKIAKNFSWEILLKKYYLLTKLKNEKK